MQEKLKSMNKDLIPVYDAIDTVTLRRKFIENKYQHVEVQQSNKLDVSMEHAT